MLLSQTTKACVVKYDFHPTVSGSHIAVILEGIFAGQTPSQYQKKWVMVNTCYLLTG